MTNKAYKKAIKWLSKGALTSLALVTLVITAQPVEAFTLNELIIPGVEITSHSATSETANGETTIDPSKGEAIYINYCLSQDAYVTLGIYGQNPVDAYSSVSTLKDNNLHSSGCHSVAWWGTYGSQNTYGTQGQIVPDGNYYYGINVTNSTYSQDTAYVSDWVYVKTTSTVNQTPESITLVPKDHKQDPKIFRVVCNCFWDLPNGYQYCDATTWAKDYGIFIGYQDGSFQPDRYITRVEALKAIMETAKLSPSYNYYNLGFPDADMYAWYAPYVKRGMEKGIIHGYPDGYLRPNTLVNHVEALKMLLNTGVIANNIVIPSQTNGMPYYDTPATPDTRWYLSYAWMAKNYNLSSNPYYFYPGSAMTRGEMADMLYRYHLAGLDK